MSEEELPLFILNYTTAFKKDLKKYKKQPQKIKKIANIIDVLTKKGTEGIPIERKPHPLIGNYKGCMECHIEPDLLLIWKQYDQEKIIVLDRVGTHSELFDN